MNVFDDDVRAVGVIVLVAAILTIFGDSEVMWCFYIAQSKHRDRGRLSVEIGCFSVCLYLFYLFG